MSLKRKNDSKAEIPTSSMPDIIFMLLIFFMMTTVLRTFEGLDVVLPKARQISAVDVGKRHVAYIFVGRDGTISIDDKLVKPTDVSKAIYSKRDGDPKLVVSLRADQKVEMSRISSIHEELRKASALKLNYSSKSRPNPY
ncbi:MAG: biopolymer transporter ExbD [Candidatus Marinimicrobia bacterium]|nr:biopolymer transporter ExbD [Candidatus Neomarinimicrobiota bacterium]